MLVPLLKKIEFQYQDKHKTVLETGKLIEIGFLGK